MINLRDFVLTTIKQMVGNLPNYQIRQYATAWYDKGVLNDDDIAEIDSLTNPIPADLPTYAEQEQALEILLEGGASGE